MFLDLAHRVGNGERLLILLLDAHVDEHLRMVTGFEASSDSSSPVSAMMRSTFNAVARPSPVNR
jgi:hypothetical protein